MNSFHFISPSLPSRVQMRVAETRQTSAWLLSRIHLRLRRITFLWFQKCLARIRRAHMRHLEGIILTECRREDWIMEFQKEFNYQPIANTSKGRENIYWPAPEEHEPRKAAPTPPPVACDQPSPSFPGFAFSPVCTGSSHYCFLSSLWWIDSAFNRNSTRPGVAV